MSERMLVLNLVENGKLSIEEAEALLNALVEDTDQDILRLPISGLQMITLDYDDDRKDNG